MITIGASHSIAAPRASLLVRAMSAIDRTIARIELATLALACTALFAIMLLIFLDAVLRYSMNSPLKFTVDVVNLYLISAALLLVLSDTLRRGGHICVDLFAHWMPARLHHATMGIALLGSFAVVAIMANETRVLSWESWHNNETMVGIYAWPLWLSKVIVAFSLALLDLRLLHLGLANLIAGLTGHLALAVPISHLEDHPAEDGV